MRVFETIELTLITNPPPCARMIGIPSCMAAIARLKAIWHPHTAIEEEHFSIPTLARVFAPEEHLHLLQHISEYSRTHMVPGYLVTPFMIYNLAADDRISFTRALPPVIIDEMIPVTWAAKWAPMKPFLLE